MILYSSALLMHSCGAVLRT